MTPEQAAEYLQVNKETVYRYVRQGKLVASQLGRNYRIPRRSLDLLLWATRTRRDISLREYTGVEIGDFLRADELTPEARRIADRFTQAIEAKEASQSEKAGRADSRS